MQKGGRWHNDHFVLMSHFGIGSNQGEMPSTAINFVEACDRIEDTILSFWGENIRWIEDYRDVGSNGNAGRVYIGTSAFCQNLGPSPLQSIRDTFTEVAHLVGRFAPALAPYASTASKAYRLQAKLQRLADLRSRPSLLSSETACLQWLAQELQSAFPSLTL
jgi:hypothetical protein